LVTGDTNTGGKITLSGRHSDDAKKIIDINPNAVDDSADLVTVTDGTLKLDTLRDALLALEDRVDEMEDHYAAGEGDFSRDIDADLNFLKDYNGDAATSDKQKIYALGIYKETVDL
jgi:hypothetical protein